MRRCVALTFVIMNGLACALPAFGQDAARDEETFFETRIRPVLASRCVECHGETKASGGLRLDSREGVMKGGDTGKAVVPGDVEASLLATAIKHDENETLKMPPKKPLAKEVVEDLTAWIAGGAKWPDSATAPIVSEKPHWAFAPLKVGALPEDPSGWATQPIDRFVAAARGEQGLKPVRAADKPTLIRRAYFDLIGLPPSPEQVAAFVADERPEAFAAVIEELLASPRYGERWGRHWLDLVRYADTAGDNSDYPIPQAHLYRDYVIDAFNADLPYDRFLHEQLAGDILAREAPAEDYNRLVVATGFIAQSKRIGTRELEDMHLIIEDTLATMGPVVMGLSVRCARCHDHKYDPITQKDYYALYGFFASTQYPFPGGEEVRKQTKFAPLMPAEQLREHQAKRTAELAEVKAAIERDEKASETGRKLDELEPSIAQAEEQLKGVEEAEKADLEAKLKELKTEQTAARDKLKRDFKARRDELTRREQDPLEGIPTAYAVYEAKPVNVSIQKGGNPRSQGPVAPRGVPQVLDPSGLAIPEGTSGRLELARWMTEKGAFLTARVMANRIWQQHFGKPLVATPSDFGFRGSSPTHPELLEWLAAEFISSGWSIKEMHRRIMLSKTYRLSSELDDANFAADSGNAWYWRFDRRRLDAESLRDTILSLGGTLDLSRPGAHPFPEPSKWRWTAHRQFNQVTYPSNHRSVYLMVQRLHAHPYLSLFNGADASLTTPTRDTSTVSLQALFLLNNEMVHKQAAGFATRLVSEVPDRSARIDQGYLRAFGRGPSSDERARCLAYLDRYQSALAEEGIDPAERESEAWSSLARTWMASNQFFYVD